MKGAPIPVVSGRDDQESWTIAPARYAKGMVAFHVKKNVPDGWMGRMSRLCSYFGRYSHRERSYIMSPTRMHKMLKIHSEGGDYSPITGRFS